MACPLFYPVERFGDSAWRKHPRLPLGDPYSGACRADPKREWLPDQATLRDCCNLGYARERCPRFPQDGGPDAFRFSVVSDDGGTLKIFYIAERGHAPVEHGTIEYAAATGQLLNGHTGEIFQKQARAYVESYLRRKHEPDNEAKYPHRR
jgi:hypothetical protein